MPQTVPCDPVWVTTWMHEANRPIGPRLGLPPPAVPALPDKTGDPIGEWFGRHWKTPNERLP